MRGRFPAMAGLALVLGSAGPLAAAQPIPLRAGTYCGPGDAKIVVDIARDQVTIDDMVCSFPVIAADHMQSDKCTTPQGQSSQQNIDFSVVGPAFFHAGSWYRRCGDGPAR